MTEQPLSNNKRFLWEYC